MKKLTILTSVLALATMSAMSQGYINALNNGTAAVIKVSDPAINGGTAVTAGTAANAAGFVGAGPGSVTVSMFVEPAGTDLSTPSALAALLQTTPYATSPLTSSTIGPAQGSIAWTAGAWGGGNPFTLPTGNAYNGSASVEFVLYGITSNGKYAGFSSIGNISPAVAGSGAPAPALFGTGAGQISSFVLTPVPEPSTIILGGLGAAALLAFRRRK